MELPRLINRIKGKLQSERNKILIKQMREQLQVRDFTIISQNCIGGIFYHDMEMKFSSPTINLFFKCPDFVKFVQNLEYYMGLELRMSWGEEYPIGYLDDLTIYFMHYQTCEEAKRKWEERKKRIKWEKIIVFCTDMEDFDDATYGEWEKITYPKILFSAKNWGGQYNICFPHYIENGHVLDLISKREFYKDGELIKYINELE